MAKPRVDPSVPTPSKGLGTMASRTEGGAGSSYVLCPARNEIQGGRSGEQNLLPSLSQMASPRNTAPSPRRFQLLRGPDGSQEANGGKTGPHGSSHKARTQEGPGLRHGLSAQHLGGRCPRSQHLYLTAVGEDDHHAAVQGAVVPPRQLHQSLDHLLREKVSDKAEQGRIGSPRRAHLGRALPLLPRPTLP